MKFRLVACVFGALAALVLVRSPAHAAIFDVSTPGVAAFRVWVPDNVPAIRGVIVYHPGAGGDGRFMAQSAFWQAAATYFHFGVVGSQYLGSGYVNVKNGSGDALLRALAEVAVTSKHPELAHVAMGHFGFSNGGGVSFNWAAWKPERVIFFMENKGAFSYPNPPDPAFLVPGIFVLGSEGAQSNGDRDGNAGYNANLKTAFTAGRAKGALWSLAMDWGADHIPGREALLAAAYAARLIKARVPCATPSSAPLPLAPVTAAGGFLGDNSTWRRPVATFTRADSFTGDRAAASWLPDGHVAAVWAAVTTERAPVGITGGSNGGAMATFSATGMASEMVALQAGDLELNVGTGTATATVRTPGVLNVLAFVKDATGARLAVSRPVNAVIGNMPGPDADTCATGSGTGGNSGTGRTDGSAGAGGDGGMGGSAGDRDGGAGDVGAAGSGGGAGASGQGGGGRAGSTPGTGGAPATDDDGADDDEPADDDDDDDDSVNAAKHGSGCTLASGDIRASWAVVLLAALLARRGRAWVRRRR